MFRSEVYANRRNRLIEIMPEEFLIVVPPSTSKSTSADGQYPYTPNLNLVYLTGIDQPGTWLVIHRRKAMDAREDLFINAYDETHAKWFGTVLTKEEATERSGIEKISFNSGVKKWIDRIINRWGIENVWVDFPVAGITRDSGKRLEFANDLISSYPQLNFNRLSGDVFRLRMIKGPEELETMKKAIALTRKGFLRALKALKPGMLEYEFEAELLYEFMKNGEKTPAFPAIVAGGSRATCLHYVDNDKPLDDGTLVLLDFGARKDYYNADISRTFPVSGKFTERQRELVEMVIGIQEEAIRLLRPGKLHSEWNSEVKKFYTEVLMEKGIIENEEEIEKFYYHNIGHHLGLDTHDENVISDELKAGMVLTVEPGFYSEEEGIGIRIEDDVLIGERRNTVLSADIPKYPEEIETVMKEGE
ncbi:MAG: aminopeptidase P N-terminal domain-containing protein [Candidatus Aegiribacteria sp.]|nr:aminopeptidase P N-terminal domain-containing protein [Candidatus Aegiribacteria sp.]